MWHISNKFRNEESQRCELCKKMWIKNVFVLINSDGRKFAAGSHCFENLLAKDCTPENLVMLNKSLKIIVGKWKTNQKGNLVKIFDDTHMRYPYIATIVSYKDEFRSFVFSNDERLLNATAQTLDEAKAIVAKFMAPLL